MALAAVFGLSGFMRYIKGYSGLPNGGEVIGMALAATGVTFFAL